MTLLLRPRQRWCVPVALLLTMSGCTDGTDAAPDSGMMSPDQGMPAPDGGMMPHEGEITMGRLIVADGTSASLRIVDLDEGTAFAPVTLTSTARVYANPAGRYGYAVQAAGNRVDIFDSGILFTSHDDHYHISKDDPSMLDTHLDGDTPIHFVIHGEEGMPNSWYASSFNDGTGVLQLIQERSLSTASPVMFDADTGDAHHGVGLVALGHVIVTLPNEDGGLPIGVTLRELATPDDIEDTYDNCPNLHGEATNHHGVAFGCGDGVLLLEAHDDHFDALKLDYPVDVPDDVRIGTLRSSHELEVFVGNWDGGLVIVDPETAPYFTPVPIAETVLDFAVDDHGEVLVVLTADGNLHRLNPLTGAALGDPVSVMDAFEVMPGHSQVRPTFTLGAGAAFVIDPRQTDVMEVHLDEWEIERRIAVGGSPGSIAICSVSPDFGEAHEH